MFMCDWKFITGFLSHAIQRWTYVFNYAKVDYKERILMKNIIQLTLIIWREYAYFVFISEVCMASN